MGRPTLDKIVKPKTTPKKSSTKKTTKKASKKKSTKSKPKTGRPRPVGIAEDVEIVIPEEIPGEETEPINGKEEVDFHTEYDMELEIEALRFQKQIDERFKADVYTEKHLGECRDNMLLILKEKRKAKTQSEKFDLNDKLKIAEIRFYEVLRAIDIKRELFAIARHNEYITATNQINIAITSFIQELQNFKT